MHKILVVDDEVSYRELLKEVFTEQGFHVRTASGSTDAREIASTFVPDVLIVDWMLSDEHDGSAVALLCQQLNPNVGIVFISGYPSVGLQAAADEDPSIAWLPKPFHLDQVMSAVQSISDPLLFPKPSQQLE